MFYLFWMIFFSIKNCKRICLFSIRLWEHRAANNKTIPIIPSSTSSDGALNKNFNWVKTPIFPICRLLFLCTIDTLAFFVTDFNKKYVAWIGRKIAYFSHWRPIFLLLLLILYEISSVCMCLLIFVSSVCLFGIALSADVVIGSVAWLASSTRHWTHSSTPIPCGWDSEVHCNEFNIAFWMVG